MYFDTKPCHVCGAKVELRPRVGADPDATVEPDGVVDERVCTNADCPTHRPGSEEAP